MDKESLAGTVGIFFVVNRQTLVHTCRLANARKNGDFLNYPFSHDYVWQTNYMRKYGVDFDYYPRGRMIYNKPSQSIILYHDVCARPEAEKLVRRYSECTVELRLDEHYQCHQCNLGYVK